MDSWLIEGVPLWAYRQKAQAQFLYAAGLRTLAKFGNVPIAGAPAWVKPTFKFRLEVSKLTLANHVRNFQSQDSCGAVGVIGSDAVDVSCGLKWVVALNDLHPPKRIWTLPVCQALNR